VSGTIINIITVLVGGTLGILFGARLPERLRHTVLSGLGLFTAAFGIQMFLETENAIIVLGSLLIGGVIGEWWKIESKLNSLGKVLERKFTRQVTPDSGSHQLNNHSQFSPGVDSSRFIKGFLTSSLVFCVGPMTILGSIQDGLTGDYRILAIKSVLDGFAALAFSSTLGVGVLFSTLVIFTYQGGLSLLAGQAQVLITAGMMNEMTAVGGLLLLGISVSSLLEIKPIRVGNLLPALAIAPVIVSILERLGVSLI
jgi:uncharacterized membrane protein YqgA involved in biofilm formation